jgi:hypothetical protein
MVRGKCSCAFDDWASWMAYRADAASEPWVKAGWTVTATREPRCYRVAIADLHSETVTTFHTLADFEAASAYLEEHPLADRTTLWLLGCASLMSRG